MGRVLWSAFVLLLCCSRFGGAQAPGLAGPLQAQYDFETTFLDEVEKVGDTKNLTSAQKQAAWKSLEDQLVAKLGTKPWTITLKVEDVRPDTDNKSDKAHLVYFASDIEMLGAKCRWKLGTSRILLPMNKATAEKIHKGDYLTFTGMPLKLDSDATAAKKAEYTRRVGRGLAVSVSIIHEKSATFTVVIAELKYTLPK